MALINYYDDHRLRIDDFKFGKRISIYYMGVPMIPKHDTEIFIKHPTHTVVKYKHKGKNVKMGLYKGDVFNWYEGIQINWH